MRKNRIKKGEELGGKIVDQGVVDTERKRERCLHDWPEESARLPNLRQQWRKDGGDG